MLLEEEKSMSESYYVLYNATTFDWIYYYYFMSLIRYIILKKPICTLPLMRFKNLNAVNPTGSPVSNVAEAVADINLKIKNNVEGYCDFRTLSFNDPRSLKNLDHYSWAKEYMVPMNLSLCGGVSGVGESTIGYFKSAKVQTSNAISFLTKYIDSLDYLPNESKHKFKQKILQSFIKMKMKSGEKSILTQTFIKKSEIDKVAILTTPFGFPLPMPLSQYLELMQLGEMKKLEEDIETFYTLPDEYFPIEPKETKKRMNEEIGHPSRNPYCTKGLRNVQARFIPVNEELITTPGNVIVNNWTSSGYSLNPKLNEIYKIVLELVLECKNNPKCKAHYTQENYWVESMCNIS